MPESVPNKPRNRRAVIDQNRAKNQRKHSAQSLGRQVATLIGLVLLLGFAAVAIYAVFFFDAESLRRFNEAYAVLEKHRIEGKIIESKPKPGALSKGFSQRLDPTFQLVCLADFTRTQYVFQVPEEVYNQANVNKIFPASQTGNWELISVEEISLKDFFEQKTGLDLGQ